MEKITLRGIFKKKIPKYDLDNYNKFYDLKGAEKLQFKRNLRFRGYGFGG